MNLQRLLISLGLLLFLSPKVIFAEQLGTVGVYWQNLTFQAEEEEDTPNFFGYGLRLEYGYELGDTFELKLFASHNMSQKNSAKFFDGDVEISNGGVNLGFRLVKSVYLGVDFGYKQFDSPSHHIHNETVGLWKGTGAAFHLGGYWKIRGYKTAQVSLQISSYNLANDDGLEAVERKVDTVSLNMTYLLLSSMK